MNPYTVFLLIVLLWSPAVSQTDGAHAGRKAPDFVLEDMSGDSYQLHTALGKGPIIISFWATWCKPCLEELTEFKKVYNSYKSRGVTLLAISTDSEKNIAKVKPLVRARDFPYTVLLDTNSKVARLFYAHTIPYTAVLDKDGNIVYSHVGYKRGDELVVQKVLDDLLTQQD